MSETFRAQVDADGGIEYSQGIARQYNIEAGDSIRVELVEISSGEGRTRSEPGEVFFVDLEGMEPTTFALPGEIREQYDITGDDIVRLHIHQLIKDDYAKTLGDASKVTPPEGEPVFSVVEGQDQRVSFADGLARLHDIEKGQSVRVTLTEVTMPWGDTVHENLEETFVADLFDHDPTSFTIPNGVTKEYKIREGGFVRFRMHAVIDEGEVRQITDRRESGKKSSSSGYSDIDRIESRNDGGRAATGGSAGRTTARTGTGSRAPDTGPSAGTNGGRRGKQGNGNGSSRQQPSGVQGSPAQASSVRRSERSGRSDWEQGGNGSDAGTVSGLSNATQDSLAAAAEEKSLPTNYVPEHDARELLQAIVADAFAALEYEVETNARKATGDGNSVKEADVWGEKPGVTFTAYAACKNQQGEVGTSELDREAGRVSALQKFPHLKVIVAPRFNDNARQALDSRGFVGIETGEQATMNNAATIYDRVYTQLADLSLSLAPPRIQELAERVDQVSEELSSLSGELRELEDAPKWNR